jgi:enterochelin esterase-like enzyme
MARRYVILKKCDLRNFFKMKIILGLLSFLISFSVSFAQPNGFVFENMSIESKVLQKNIEYAIYLPPDYDNSNRTYPVLYLLHGGGDDHTAWVQSGEVQFIADKAITAGKATPMIIVMPNSKPGESRYFNGYQGEWPYEDFFFSEFIPFIEKTYRVKPEKRYRAVAGLSMGGRSAFVYAIHHPEIFACCCPLSPGAGALEPTKAREFYGPRGFNNAKDDELLAYDRNHSILRLIENMPEKQKNEVRFYLDCGDDDGLSIENALVHVALKKNNIPHEFRIRNGNHNWTYWREGLKEVLIFVSESFHK